MSDDRPSSFWVAVGFAWRLGYSIAVPLVVLLGVGRLLDLRWGTSPWLMLAGLALSFVATNVLMFREALRVMKEAGQDEAHGRTVSSTRSTSEHEQENVKFKDQNVK